MLKLELPYPPSVNHYWRHYRGRTVISENGLRFRSTVRWILAKRHVVPMTDRLAVTIEVFPPDHRRRDLDNLLKAIGDSLERGGAFIDDEQVVWLLIEKNQVVPGGKITVKIEERP